MRAGPLRFFVSTCIPMETKTGVYRYYRRGLQFLLTIGDGFEQFEVYRLGVCDEVIGLVIVSFRKKIIEDGNRISWKGGLFRCVSELVSKSRVVTRGDIVGRRVECDCFEKFQTIISRKKGSE